MSTTIEHKVALDGGTYANTVGSAANIEAMYPVGMTDPSEIYFGTQRVDQNGVYMQPVNSVLRFRDLPDGRRSIEGGTVTRNCPVTVDCGSCALTGLGMSVEEMSGKNCARANTARAFELAYQPPEGRFVLLPTSKNSYVVSADRLTPERSGGELMQYRLASAPSVVFTRSWLKDRGLEQLTVAMNGADGSMGVATTSEIDGESLIIPFCSMRENMGDRSEDDQILRQALNAYFDSKGFDEDKRREILDSLKISVTLAASASLKNFAHQIRIPREDEDAPQADRDRAAAIRARRPDLVERAKGRLTSAIVLDYQYPGALERGSIFPEFEARIGIRETPITPDNCPGDGQYCHVDYRTETRYALTKQLRDMGVSADNIEYDDRDTLDPADPGNKAASNRAEQNNGVKVGDTNRTLNAMIIRI